MKDIFKYYQSMKGLSPRNLIVLPALLYKDNHILNLLFSIFVTFNYPKKINKKIGKKTKNKTKGMIIQENTVTLVQNKNFIVYATFLISLSDFHF